MLPANRFAFKEWAAVRVALASGRQTVLLRKGGLHEGRDGFRVEHPEFWILPTRFHQAADELTPEGAACLARSRADLPAEGLIRLRSHAVVTDVLHVLDATLLPRIAAEHVLSPRTVQERFDYRAPGLFVLVVRIHERPEPLDVPDSPHIAGCRSWVDLPAELSTAGLAPVLSDAEFAARRDRIVAALSETRTA